MAYQRKTKIVATLGPACADEASVTAMVHAGMNVARVNFSHGDHDTHRTAIALMREVSQKTGVPVAVLQDLSGPKIRIGDFVDGAITLKRGATFTLTTKAVPGTAELVSISYRSLPKEVEPGMVIMLNDGKVELKVVRTTDTDIVTKVVVGGFIRSRRGVNVPAAKLSIPTITVKDKRDITFGIEVGVDIVTLSFVRHPRDINKLRTLLGETKDRVSVFAKIETREAVEHIDEIIEAADGIMVARGDLAVEIPKEEVPLLQKLIIRKCNAAGKPVITATQMLDSMKEQTVPTRAEVNDVANAIFDGTDAVMLSDETAVGEHPALAVATLSSIACKIESSDLYHEECSRKVYVAPGVAHAITRAVADTAQTIDAKVLVALSETGTTARLIARHRAKQPIVVLTPNEKAFTQSLVVFGCIPVMVKQMKDLAQAVAAAREAIAERTLMRKGESFILGAGTAFGRTGATNVLMVEQL